MPEKIALLAAWQQLPQGLPAVITRWRGRGPDYRPGHSAGVNASSCVTRVKVRQPG
jgi:hypothetical protein